MRRSSRQSVEHGSGDGRNQQATARQAKEDGEAVEAADPQQAGPCGYAQHREVHQGRPRSRPCRLCLHPEHHLVLRRGSLATSRDEGVGQGGRQGRGGIHALGAADEPAHGELLHVMDLLRPQDRHRLRHAGDVPDRRQRRGDDEPAPVRGTQEALRLPDGDLRARGSRRWPRPAAGTDHPTGTTSATAPRDTRANPANSGTSGSCRLWNPSLPTTTLSLPRPTS